MLVTPAVEVTSLCSQYLSTDVTITEGCPNHSSYRTNVKVPSNISFAKEIGKGKGKGVDWDAPYIFLPQRTAALAT